MVNLCTPKQTKLTLAQKPMRLGKRRSTTCLKLVTFLFAVNLSRTKNTIENSLFKLSSSSLYDIIIDLYDTQIRSSIMMEKYAQ